MSECFMTHMVCKCHDQEKVKLACVGSDDHNILSMHWPTFTMIGTSTVNQEQHDFPHTFITCLLMLVR